MEIKRLWGNDPPLRGGKKWDSKRIYTCLNCGEAGHFHRSCRNAVTSYGIIAVAFGDDFRGAANDDNVFTCEKHKDLEKLPVCNAKEMKISSIGEPCFLLIHRKNTMAFVDICRGKYSSPLLTFEKQHECMMTHINELTCEERDILCRYDFDDIWKYLWVNHASPAFRREYDTAKRLFNEFNVVENVKKSQCQYHMTEVEMPKGRRQVVEQPIECAAREFFEETGYSSEDVKILDLNPVIEEFEGTNAVKYRHVYFFAHMRPSAKLPKMDLKNELQAGEIRNVGWFTLQDCERLFRPYNQEKLTLLKNVVIDVVPLIREMVRSAYDQPRIRQ
jgi:8-oxo-dGTP pyrophosphatase MutT (NUDIX family)